MERLWGPEDQRTFYQIVFSVHGIDVVPMNSHQYDCLNKPWIMAIRIDMSTWVTNMSQCLIPRWRATGCSSKVPGLDFQHSHSNTILSRTLVPEHLIPSSDLYGHHTYLQYTYIYAGKTSIMQKKYNIKTWIINGSWKKENHFFTRDKPTDMFPVLSGRLHVNMSNTNGLSIFDIHNVCMCIHLCNKLFHTIISRIL